MKKLLSLILMTMFMLTSANDKFGTPVISKFSIANYEVLNINTGKYLYKKVNCENQGYSMFSPFSVNPELLNTSFTSKLDDNGQIVFTTFVKGESSKYVFKNFQAFEDGSKVTFDIMIDNKVYNSALSGENLTILDVQNFLTSSTNSEIGKIACPPCAVVAAAAIAKTIIDVCTTASQGCTPCNGTLVVGACSCSCTPK